VSLKPVPFGADVTIAVSQVLKGQAGNTINVLQGGGLVPADDAAWASSDWHGVLIADIDCAPLLLPDDSVFLFLTPWRQGFEQESWTGAYYVRGGTIQALPFNPFASQVNGLSPGEFATAITNA
jgi:hypothetical protein